MAWRSRGSESFADEKQVRRIMDLAQRRGIASSSMSDRFDAVFGHAPLFLGEIDPALPAADGFRHVAADSIDGPEFGTRCLSKRSGVSKTSSRRRTRIGRFSGAG